jgi:DNA-binding XRE family transcriptional regulator
MDLESFRKSRDLSQADLAKALGLRSKGYISSIERGTFPCPLKVALDIERYTGGLVTAASLCDEAKDVRIVQPDGAAAS